ncbi:HAD-IIIC family phosphatase [Vibrio vulnificus]|nr:HAD-IIIC family phosphatase [Vibrio vulnificus]HAS8589939.1 HAD-IIIC family phosphatase [Vibrio vulnificus]
MKNLVVDLDGTLTLLDNNDYSKVSPRKKVIEKLRRYKEEGFTITIATARNMRTFEGNLGKINIHTLPTIIEWLNKHEVPYDNIILGKPWCGNEGFYIDDKSVRPSEFENMSFNQVKELLAREVKC